jgi:hypothetical protein
VAPSLPQAPAAPSTPATKVRPTAPAGGKAPAVSPAPAAAAGALTAGAAAIATPSPASQAPVAGGPAAALRAATVPITAGLERVSPAVRRREIRLRRMVARFRSCLTQLPRNERRVLALRAGLDGRPHSRRGVARITRWSVRRVRLLENGGLRRLRSLGDGGGCGSGRQTTAVAAHTTPGALTTDSLGRTAPAPAGGAGPAVLAEHVTGTQSLPGVQPLRAPPGLTQPNVPSPASDMVTRALIALAFAGLVWVFVSRERRR